MESLSSRLWGDWVELDMIVISRKLVEVAFIFYGLIGLCGVELDLCCLQANKLCRGEAVFYG
ncbi:MAG: hypothetical protein VX196_06280, partial [Pseudomonadota bacterium]|nr:hypothetical protein [Pseudomonadota bacterium]